jgi:hypothetical protein
MDLFTTVMHELGHVLGHEHDDGDDLMAPTLQARARPVAEPEPGQTASHARTVADVPAATTATAMWPWSADSRQPQPLVDWTTPADGRGPSPVALERSRRWDWDVVDLAAGDGAPDANADLVVALDEDLVVVEA